MEVERKEIKTFQMFTHHEEEVKNGEGKKGTLF